MEGACQINKTSTWTGTGLSLSKPSAPLPFLERCDAVVEGYDPNVVFSTEIFTSAFVICLVFGLGHHCLYTTSIDNYDGFGSTDLRVAWFDYLYFAAMTLVGAEGGATPLSVEARLLTFLNTVTGVVLLVFGVTAFSMVSRDLLRDNIALAKQDFESLLNTEECTPDHDK